MLTGLGMAPSAVGRLLGLLRKQLPDDEVLVLIRRVEETRPLDIKSWLLGAARVQKHRTPETADAPRLLATDPPEAWQRVYGGKIEDCEGSPACALGKTYVDVLARDVLALIDGDEGRAWDWDTVAAWCKGFDYVDVMAACKASLASMARRGEPADSVRSLRFFDRAVREGWGAPRHAGGEG